MVVLICRYECIETDLLGALKFSCPNIAPYKSKGIERATELNGGQSTKANNNITCQKAHDQTNGKFSILSHA